MRRDGTIHYYIILLNKTLKSYRDLYRLLEIIEIKKNKKEIVMEIFISYLTNMLQICFLLILHNWNSVDKIQNTNIFSRSRTY